MADRFTDEPWSSPEADLSPADFCKVCLVDTNDPGADKVKAKCKLPVRASPGAPINRNALRNAASRMPQMTGVSPEMKARARRMLDGLLKSAGIG
jgi:hypothetical protein